MEDYLSESEQWERVKAWLRSNGAWIVAGIAVGALVVFGLRWNDARVNRLALEAGSKYQQLLEALDKGDKTRALTLTGELEREYPKSPYVDQAHLLAARLAVEDGDLAKAQDTLKSVMEKTKDEQLALVARLRLARVQLARNKPDEAIATLGAVTEPGAFKGRYSEVRGDALLAKGDKEGALKEYRAALGDVQSQSLDTQSLELKIDDLLAASPPPAAASTPAPAPAPAQPADAAATKPAEAK